MSGTSVLINLLGSVALLLWGLRMVRTGVTRGYGNEIQSILGWSLSNRFKSFISGLGVTMLLQSSTATSLLTSSFAGRGLVSVAPGLAVLLGADVGTTLVAQVFSFDLSLLIPVFMFVGVTCFLSTDGTRVQNFGRLTIGLGLMLQALKLIVAASAPMRDSEGAQSLLSSLVGEPILAVLVGAILTWMAHSSLATVLLVVSLAAVGVIPAEVSFALVLGANLGGALPPIMATMGAEVSARRPPLGNFLFRMTGVIIALPFISIIGDQLASIDGDISRQIVNFHTVFNILLAAAFLPFIGLMEKITIRLLPDPPVSEDAAELKPMYLDSAAYDSPQLALANAVRETMRMGDVVQTMFRDLFTAMQQNDTQLIKKLVDLDDIVDDFYAEIKKYLTELSREPLGEKDSRRCTDVMIFTTNLEHIGDIVVMNLAELAQRKARKNIVISKDDQADIQEIVDHVNGAMQLSFSVLLSGGTDAARDLLASKQELSKRERKGIDDHLERLRTGKSQHGDASGVYLDILRDLRRINSHLTSVAYPILEAAGELRPNRLKTREKVQD